MDEAAAEPIGPESATKTGIGADVVVGIAIPLVVPALVLALFRVDGTTSYLEGLRLSEVAFGFGSVAIASIVRSISQRPGQWQTFVSTAVLLLILQTAIGLSTDSTKTADASANTIRAALTETGHLKGASADHAIARWEQLGRALVADADRIDSDTSPSFLWIASLLIGLTIIVYSIVSIVRVRE